MLDTMTFTKIVGGLCGSLLIFLLGNWAADALYATGGGHGGHGEEGEHHAGYIIETDVGGGAAEEEVEVDFATLMAAADPGAGEKVFKKCKACHKTEDGANATGPFLYGIVGRAIGGVDGFKYSGALGALGDSWTPEALNAFLENPKATAPGTSMSFKGLGKPEDRANLIAYLDGLDG